MGGAGYRAQLAECLLCMQRRGDNTPTVLLLSQVIDEELRVEGHSWL